MKRLAAMVLATICLLWACDPSDSPLVVEPAFLIEDAVHNQGNPHFYWLPPMADATTPTGVFDATVEPTVQICEYTGTECVMPFLAEFTLFTGPGSETVRIAPEEEQFVVNWHTDEFSLNPEKTYRIRVVVSGQILGLADVDVVESGSELRRVDTGLYIALKDGRTLPIKFRVEEGALLGLFAVTEEVYDHNNDMDQICRQTFGPEWRNTDWQDVEEVLAGGMDIEEIQPADKAHAWMTHYGTAYWSGRRFFASRQIHPGYLVHYRLDASGSTSGSPVLYMGSWYGDYHVNCTTLMPPDDPDTWTLAYADDFSSGLGNWTVRGGGTWSTPNEELVGDYNIGCGSTTCSQSQLLLADSLQPGGADWRMEIQSGLVQEYPYYNGGSIGNKAKFSLWVSESEKEAIQVGESWQGTEAPTSANQVQVNHQDYPWVSFNQFDLTVDAWNPHVWQTVVLEKRGNDYSLFFNGVEVYRVTRTFSSPPKIGLHTYAKVRMDNFRLYQRNEAAPYNGP